MKKTYLFIFLLISAFSAINFLIDGVHVAPDSRDYSEWADLLIRNKFNIVSCMKLVSYEVSLYFHMGFLSVVAFAKMINGQSWPKLLVVLNSVSFGLTGVMVAYVVYALTKKRSYVWFITVIYTFNHELFQWLNYILSDAIYLAINFVVYYLIVRIFKSRDKRHIFWYWGAILISLAINILFRPVGIVMIPVILISFLIWNFYQKRPLFRTRTLTRYFLLGGIALFAAMIYIHSLILSNLNAWPIGFGKAYFNKYIIPAYQQGVVINQRPHINHQPPKTLLDYAAITGDKFIHYFYFRDHLYSLRHNVLNTVFFMPLYFLFLLGIAGLMFKDNECKEDECLVIIAASAIFMYALFHALICIDYDWRYRLPVMPYLLVVAAFGILTFNDMKTSLRKRKI